ncbi:MULTISPECIES: PHP domain-containing protein [unclassified Candidatus Frackibacter]|uniref:PHP domain-containing protein n=1 Tax=unclassified Candidatus Frackibacter TaxID=2648818 RepID=UPI00088BB41B|nr:MULTISPECIES: PHP domain-containing protein [unclassified Candidatus Frackibacter]SDC41874.1 hypothetical protein SAMN04515661_10998 [Candidatus Frackibacter sp. WG11]SEM59170.1 hypothetical protein SAMN04488698_10822 [Candidatus Frackibacter sp. WG12]SFL62944.1 hypothetical protein SAMN04488699_10797 [Candidatus Frackibacter sp. WG13]
MLKEYQADFHVHTVLSPCGDIIMTPQNIIDTAQARGIDILAVTDHNSAENLRVTMELAEESKIKIIPGMEVETKEGIHLIALFSDLEQVIDFQKIIYNNLPSVKNNEDLFGPQLITNNQDKFIDRLERLLLISANLSLEKIVNEVRQRNGVVYPAHIDRKEYSILTNLGFIPAEIDFPVLEVSKHASISDLYNRFPLLRSYQLVRASDAHYLHDIVPNLSLKLAEPTLEEILLAFRRESGREVEVIE